MIARVNAVAIFCEDIRDEIGSKYSLIGILSDNIAIPHVPAAMPKFGIFVRINIPVEFEIMSDISVTAHFPGAETVDLLKYEMKSIKEEQTKAAGAGAIYVGLLMKAVSTLAAIATYGQLRVIVQMNGEEIVAGHLNFVQGG